MRSLCAPLSGTGAQNGPNRRRHAGPSVMEVDGGRRVGQEARILVAQPIRPHTGFDAPKWTRSPMLKSCSLTGAQDESWENGYVSQLRLDC